MSDCPVTHTEPPQSDVTRSVMFAPHANCPRRLQACVRLLWSRVSSPDRAIQLQTKVIEASIFILQFQNKQLFLYLFMTFFCISWNIFAPICLCETASNQNISTFTKIKTCYHITLLKFIRKAYPTHPDRLPWIQLSPT